MNCQNCEHHLTDEDLFCSQCGAPKKVNRLTIKSVLKEFFERYFSFDNKFLLTSLTLLKNPELVVNGYINGLRIRYVNPITYLVVAATLSGIQTYLLNNGFIEFDMDFANQDEKIPFSMKDYNDWIFNHQNLLLFGSIPILALISKIVFFKHKEFNFAEHNLIYLYTYSFCSIFTLVFVLPIVLAYKGPFSHYAVASYIILLGYHVFALKRIFNLTGKQILKRSLLFILVLAAVYFLFIIIATVGMLFYMISSGQMNLPK